MEVHRCMTSKEVAEFLHISYTEMKRRLKSKSGLVPPFYMIGDKRRWRLEDILSWMDGLRVDTERKGSLGTGA